MGVVVVYSNINVKTIVESILGELSKAEKKVFLNELFSDYEEIINPENFSDNMLKRVQDVILKECVDKDSLVDIIERNKTEDLQDLINSLED